MTEAKERFVSETIMCVCPQADLEIEQFLKEEHTFPEYEKLVIKYKDLTRELQYQVEKV